MMMTWKENMNNVSENTVVCFLQDRTTPHTKDLSETFPTPSDDMYLFCGETVPDLSLPDYVARCFRYVKCNPSTYVLAMMYIEKFLLMNRRDIYVTELTVHRLFLTALLLASKFNEDIPYRTQHFADVGGVEKWELIVAERTFLKTIEYDLYQSRDLRLSKKPNKRVRETIPEIPE